jgi:hypothetical protein
MPCERCSKFNENMLDTNQTNETFPTISISGSSSEKRGSKASDMIDTPRRSEDATRTSSDAQREDSSASMLQAPEDSTRRGSRRSSSPSAAGWDYHRRSVDRDAIKYNMKTDVEKRHGSIKAKLFDHTPWVKESRGW